MENQQINSKRLCFIDFETTGFKENAPVSLALIFCEDGKKKFTKYYLINPETEIEYGAYKVHGISQEEVEDKPNFEEIWKEISQYIVGSIVIGHQVSYDSEKVLIPTLQRYGIPVPDITTLCTCENARKLIPKPQEIKNHKLDTLCDYFNIHFDNHHTASFDTMACMRIYNRLVRISGGNLDTKFIEGDY